MTASLNNKKKERKRNRVNRTAILTHLDQECKIVWLKRANETREEEGRNEKRRSKKKRKKETRKNEENVGREGEDGGRRE
jgi:hypothetical protein